MISGALAIGAAAATIGIPIAAASAGAFSATAVAGILAAGIPITAALLVQYKASSDVVKALGLAAKDGGDKETLKQLLQDKDFAEEIATYLNDKYNETQPVDQRYPLYGEKDVTTASGTTKKDIAIAMNLAGFYALETAVGALQDMPGRQGQSIRQIMIDIAEGRLSDQEKNLVMRFANATWKAGQPFRDINRITRGAFTLWDELSPEEKDKDWVQIQNAAKKALSKLQTGNNTFSQDEMLSGRHLLLDREYRSYDDFASALRKYRNIIGADTFSGQGIFDGDVEYVKNALRQILRKYSPSDTIILGGLTNLGGIEYLYDVAEEMGFATAGIAVSKVKEERNENGTLAYAGKLRKVDHIFIQKGDWGAESRQFLDLITAVIGFGGGGQAKREMLTAVDEGKKIHIIEGIRNAKGDLGSSDSQEMRDRLNGYENKEIVTRDGGDKETFIKDLEDELIATSERLKELRSNVPKSNVNGEGYDYYSKHGFTMKILEEKIENIRTKLRKTLSDRESELRALENNRPASNRDGEGYEYYEKYEPAMRALRTEIAEIKRLLGRPLDGGTGVTDVRTITSWAQKRADNSPDFETMENMLGIVEQVISNQKIDNNGYQVHTSQSWIRIDSEKP